MDLEKPQTEPMHETTLKNSFQIKSADAEKIEIVPDIHISDKSTPVNHQNKLNSEDENVKAFGKMIDLPNVYEVCQNSQLNHQIDLLKSNVTIALDTDSCPEQVITDQDSDFRLACVNFMLNYHANQSRSPDFQETEEQATVRRAQNAERMRNYRQNLRSQETEEQAVTRRAQNALRVRNYRKFKREQPEVAAQYRAQNAFRMRMYRQRLRDVETEEQTATRRAENASRVKNYRDIKRELEPDVYRAHNAQRARDYRHTKTGTGTKTGC